MSGRHRNEFPGEPGEDGDWFTPREAAGGGRRPEGGRGPGGPGAPGEPPAPGSPEWPNPAQGSPTPGSPERPGPGQSSSGYGFSGFTGASDPGGHGFGRPPGSANGAAPGGPDRGERGRDDRPGGYGPGRGQEGGPGSAPGWAQGGAGWGQEGPGGPASPGLGDRQRGGQRMPGLGQGERPFRGGSPSTGDERAFRAAGASGGGLGSDPFDRPFPTGAAAGGGGEAGYGAYDAISRSGSGGPGGGGGYGGSGGSGGYGSGGYDYGRRKKRSAAALIGPLAGAIGLALLLGVGVYVLAGGGAGCSGGDAISLSVAAAPEIEPAIDKAVDRFNDAGHEVSGQCVEATVRPAEPAAVSTLLSGQSVASGSNTKPDVWIPDTSLWASVVGASEKGKGAVELTETSVATSPVVVALPRTLAGQLKAQGTLANPSWDSLLGAAGGLEGGGVTKNELIPKDKVRLQVPDPTRNGSGMTSLMITDSLLANDPNKASIFTGIVRTVRENTTPSVKAQFASFRKDAQGRFPVALAPEQAIWQHNRSSPSEPAMAVYPFEGTLNMDYPFAVTTADGGKKEAAGLLERAMNTEPTRADVRGLGFRSADGKPPSTFGADTGTSPQRPRQLPAPKQAQVNQVIQAWSRLSLSIRMLSVIDVSGSMAEKVSGNTTRLQASTQVAVGGLSLLPNDTELGQWVFSTNMVGSRDWQELVKVGPLGERIGSSTRRQLILSGLSSVQPKKNGDTGLFDTILGAYKYMIDSYKPEFGNSIVLLTDGKNDDASGPTLGQTLSRLRGLVDASKPVQVIMIGYGDGVDANELKKIAGATRGSVFIAQTPQDIQKIFLQALARRIQE